MTWIIVGIILGIALFGVLGCDFMEEEWKLRKRQLWSLLALVLILPSFIAKIPANSVGIVYNPFASGVSEDTLSEGFHFKNPFAKVYKFSMEVQTLQLDNIVTQTNDSQYVTNVLDIKY